MSGYQKYDHLGYTPAYGSIDVHGKGRKWAVEVSIEQGRAMEEDGIPVCWVYGAVPEWAAYPVLGRVALFLFRVFTFPARLGNWK